MGKCHLPVALYGWVDDNILLWIFSFWFFLVRWHHYINMGSTMLGRHLRGAIEGWVASRDGNGTLPPD